MANNFKELYMEDLMEIAGHALTCICRELSSFEKTLPSKDQESIEGYIFEHLELKFQPEYKYQHD